MSTTTAPTSTVHQRFDSSTLLAREILSEIQKAPCSPNDLAAYLGAPLAHVQAALTFLGHVGLARMACAPTWEAQP